MILGFKTKFPDGSPTMFIPKIMKSLYSKPNIVFEPNDWEEIEKHCNRDAFNDIVSKIHSIRSGHRWRPGMIIHMATGVRTKNYHCFAKIKCVGVQNIVMLFSSDGNIRSINFEDSGCFANSPGLISKIAKNDGLTTKQFNDWFFKSSVFDANYGGHLFEGQIIHWTNFKY